VETEVDAEETSYDMLGDKANNTVVCIQWDHMVKILILNMYSREDHINSLSELLFFIHFCTLENYKYTIYWNCFMSSEYNVSCHASCPSQQE
jgi:hypothetical protein